MSDREVIYFDADGYVTNVVVVGSDDPDALLGAYGYAGWVDHADFPEVGVGWRRADGQWRPPQPYPSWIWDGAGWVAPVPKPEEGGPWIWDEETQSWVEQVTE